MYPNLCALAHTWFRCARHGTQCHVALEAASESEPRHDVEGASPSGGLNDRNSEQNSNGACREGDRKEAACEVPARGTRRAYEATAGGRGSLNIQSPMSFRPRCRKCSGYMGRTSRVLPWEICPVAARQATQERKRMLGRSQQKSVLHCVGGGGHEQREPNWLGAFDA